MVCSEIILAFSGEKIKIGESLYFSNSAGTLGN